MKRHPTLIVLAILVGLLMAFSIAAIAIADPPPVGDPSSGTETWTGNGSENICEDGGTYHWILTGGGPGFDGYTSATLYVIFSDGTKSATGYAPGGLPKSAVHFDISGGEPLSAYAEWNGLGEPGSQVLTISHSTCDTTTTSEDTTTTSEVTTTTDEETTTTSEVTTTTDEETTTTSEVTTTTSEETTTTTDQETTTTTDQETTTTTGEETTTTSESTTTTSESTTTTSEPTTTTSEAVTTTSGSTTTTAEQEREEYPFTGFYMLFFGVAGALMAGSGLALRKYFGRSHG